MGACAYCGFCERFSCEMSAKGSLQTTLLPILLKEPKFELRTNSHVLKINLDSTGKKATGVTYLDANGHAEVIQPADMVFLTAFSLNNVHSVAALADRQTLRPPQPARALLVRTTRIKPVPSATRLLRGEDTSISSWAPAHSAMGIDDYNGDNFDHSGLDFIGGGVISGKARQRRTADSVSSDTGKVRRAGAHPGKPPWRNITTRHSAGARRAASKPTAATTSTSIRRTRTSKVSR